MLRTVAEYAEDSRGAAKLTERESSTILLKKPIEHARSPLQRSGLSKIISHANEPFGYLSQHSGPAHPTTSDE